VISPASTVEAARLMYTSWLASARDLSPHTIRAYGGDIAMLESHLPGGATVAQLDQTCVVSFLETQAATGLSPRSLRRRAAGIRGFCNWLTAEGALSTNPMADITVPPARTRLLPRVVPSDDLDKLLSSLHRKAQVGEPPDARRLAERPDDATTLLAVILMLTTGARAHEIVAIRCTDIDLRRRTVLITGKGRRQRQVFLANAWITELTGAYIQAHDRLGVPDPQLLFNSNLQALSTAALRSRLSKAAEDLGVQQKITPHMLRHTAATQLIEAGVDIRFIQRLLGHASLSTTEIYTHVFDSTLSRVVADADVLGRLLDSDN
jgi:site-specific recombinase XerD